MLRLIQTFLLWRIYRNTRPKEPELSRKEKLQKWFGVPTFFVLYSAFLLILLFLGTAVAPSNVSGKDFDVWVDYAFLFAFLVPAIPAYLTVTYFRSRIDAMPDEEDDEWY
ncbi:MAG: hypothetical protein J6A23_00090 [Thermoguttaceae bacterium]|nr:hypothetical protein [Thermoguttaceae bacterium]